MKVIKKDNNIVDFDKDKIINAINKSAERMLVKLSKDEEELVCKHVLELCDDLDKIKVSKLHQLVEKSLDKVNSEVAKSYREYRNYKKDFVNMLDDVYLKAQKIMYLGDKENSNTDSALVSTKRSLIYNELNKELYKKFFLNADEKKAIREGYIYIHDTAARRDTLNCCLFDTKSVMSGGFEMGNMWYNEPKSIDTACDVLGDIIMMSASMQYGGWSTRVDDLLGPYVKKSYEIYKRELIEFSKELSDEINYELIDKKALEKAKNDLEQGIQGLEYKLNSVASSRGDYPFTTFAVGLGSDKFEKMVSEAVLKVRMEGQGKEGKKRQVLFPKIVFLYDENLHGVGQVMEDLFDLGVECSSKSMYPDWLSLTGEGYVPKMYKEYKKVVYPMGCRAFLSPWYEKGGMKKLDETDEPIFTGRANIGAVTLNLIMIYQKAKIESKDFYETLDYYLEMIRNLHKKTYEYLGNMKASTNPLAYCEGGFLGGNLKPNEFIKPILKSFTASFGFTGLNELQQLHNKKSLVEDGEFAIETLNYINKKIEEYKVLDSRLYAIYSTPAESLCGLQIEQFRKKYGIIEGVSDKTYTSNSFHCAVSEEITPVEKQDLENRFWNLTNGGKIQYVRYPVGYNKEAIKILLRRAMKLGFYEGVNLALSYCDDCGHKEEDMEVCPICESKNLTKIDRMNGYLSYSRVNGDTRLNKAKMDEIKDRVSM
ncbi:MAG: anaerobic ribonucleoside-triphosphate reductase [Peptostreptococcaceae bacterium]